MTYKYTFYIGTNDKDTLHRELTLNEITGVLDRCFDCYTLQYGEGRYIMQKTGKVINEFTYILTTFTFDLLDIDKITSEICLKLNQESILVETERVQAKLYYNNNGGN